MSYKKHGSLCDAKNTQLELIFDDEIRIVGSKRSALNQQGGRPVLLDIQYRNRVNQ